MSASMLVASFRADDYGVAQYFTTPVSLEHYDEVKQIHERLGRWLTAHRLETPGETYDHDARPDDDPEPGDRCKDCGEDITWVGPSQDDWLHVDDEENR